MMKILLGVLLHLQEEHRRVNLICKAILRDLRAFSVLYAVKEPFIRNL
jgi:hypothetical protein